MARILIIERNPDLRDMLALLLTEHGDDVTATPDMRQGLALLRAFPEPAIVLCSLGGADTQSSEILQAAGSEEGESAAASIHRHAYILLSTTPWRLPPSLTPLIARLPVVVMSEPFDIDELMRTVEQVAERIAAGE